MAILLALFLSTSCIPCAAADTAFSKTRAYPGFSDVVEDAWCYDAVKLCYETGLLNGTSTETFSPNSPLAMEQLMVLSARLYDLRKGGDGVLPPAPQEPREYVRFYDLTGTQVANLGQVLSYSWASGDFMLTAELQTPFSPYFPLRIEFGFDGDGFRYSGSGQTGPDGKTVSFHLTPDTDAKSMAIHLNAYSRSWRNAQAAGAWDQWWFPAAFYIDYRENLDILYSPHWLVSSFGDTAWREDFAMWLSSVGGEMEQRCTVDSLPDVPGARYDAEQTEAILSLYRAGILNGTDAAGTFRGTAPLTRAQAAVMLSRVLESSLRI
ncbi:S-layer homology domain-containing protein [Oscillibacter sp. MSJ-2]|uniref:S-layer homology domain-containing protein n=1 Tax=Dysosmobacter acutus TaxID=2841504 RepID=A0ABS6F658_9FIRM|nr:S-layer homology domain-containing protein [Dysosmobacter acutus]MBU5625778.1 S-layer homology domain-containing protein [Dysosmobacter acutus]